MSKRKRDVSFLKPDEPAFIARMKAQIGYKEGPTVETKRELVSNIDAEDAEDREDELPQVVVVNDGDLTSEEVDTLQRLQEEGPADLTRRIVFRKPTKESESSDDSQVSCEKDKKKLRDMKSEERNIKSPRPKKMKNSKGSSLLSFNEEEENQ